MTEAPLLAIQNLNVIFRTPDAPVEVLRDLDLSIGRGMTVALAGESGSGKSVTALSIMGLIPPPGCIASGTIMFDGNDLATMPLTSLRALRGKRISMVFQEPMTSLNPVLTIGDQLCEPAMTHEHASRRDAEKRAVELLDKVGIPAAASRMGDYPHQLSGGMRQRVMIAMALSCSPELLIADEPTTALDVTIQAQILELLDSLRLESSMSILLITHDLGVVAERAERTCIMYAGQIVEQGETSQVLGTPSHPYTRALLASLPQFATPGKPIPVAETRTAAPGPDDRSAGCSYQRRCPDSLPHCATRPPPVVERSRGHLCRCWLK